MNRKEFRQYKILTGFINAIQMLGLNLFFKRIYFFLIYIFRYKLQHRLKLISSQKRFPSPCIFVISHVSDEDTVIIQTLNELFWHQPLSLIIAHFNFEKFYTPYIHWVKAISDKGTGDQVVERMRQALLHGRSIAIWPEGNLSRTGALMEGFTGVTRVFLQINYRSLKTPEREKKPKVPLVPIFLDGVYESLNPYSHAINIRKILLNYFGTQNTTWKVIVGKPFFLECPNIINHITLNQLTAEIMDKIRQLDPYHRQITENPLKILKHKGGKS